MTGGAQPAPDLSHLDPGMQHRVRMTIACRDADQLRKVPDAGGLREIDGTCVQVMHNGLVIELGCYYGPWMDAIIAALRGHHEPQEEVVFAAILDRLAESSDDGAMIEFGSFWSYYSMWFASARPKATVLAMEPDPAYLDVGRRNARLNDLENRIKFFHGAVGARPGSELQFVAESDGLTYSVPQHDLESIMSAAGLDRAALVLADIQGAETVLLERAADSLSTRVRFLVVSTHHHSISGSPTTHQHALQLLSNAGAHIIAEHSVSESFSGDGLIAASFDDADKSFVVEVSHNRACNSLFGGLEQELGQALDAGSHAAVDLDRQRKRVKRAESRLARSERELHAIKRSRAWRLVRRLRSVRAALARLGPAR